MASVRPRIRTDWEVIIISGCVTAGVIVLTLCLVVLAIYAAAFGIATMKAHWP